MPTLKRNIATIAANARTSAGQLTLARTGMGSARTGAPTVTTCAKMVWSANHTARLRITPTTAAVIAERAAFSALLPISAST